MYTHGKKCFVATEVVYATVNHTLESFVHKNVWSWLNDADDPKNATTLKQYIKRCRLYFFYMDYELNEHDIF